MQGNAFCSPATSAITRLNKTCLLYCWPVGGWEDDGWRCQNLWAKSPYWWNTFKSLIHTYIYGWMLDKHKWLFYAHERKERSMSIDQSLLWCFYELILIEIRSNQHFIFKLHPNANTRVHCKVTFKYIHYMCRPLCYWFTSVFITKKRNKHLRLFLSRYIHTHQRGNSCSIEYWSFPGHCPHISPGNESMAVFISVCLPSQWRDLCFKRELISSMKKEKEKEHMH